MILTMDILLVVDAGEDVCRFRGGWMLIIGMATRGIFNQGTPSIWNEENPSESLADATGGSSQANEKANRLAQMYRRPFELMHHVTLEEVHPSRERSLTHRLEMKFVLRNL